ncbi:MAG: hypothetical protein N2C14_23345 [Planctomycetales bacterium]
MDDSFKPPQPPRRLSAMLILGVAAAFLFAVAPETAVAQDKAPSPEKSAENAAKTPAGQFITIGSPISDKVFDRVRRLTQEAVREAKKEGKWLTVVFEIKSGSSDYGNAVNMARFLAGPKLSGATTVAYLPETLTGHAVLCALACDQIVMSEDAQIGEAGADEERIDEGMRVQYLEIAARPNNVPQALALAMLDPAAKAWLLETPNGRKFVLDRDLQE